MQRVQCFINSTSVVELMRKSIYRTRYLKSDQANRPSEKMAFRARTWQYTGKSRIEKVRSRTYLSKQGSILRPVQPTRLVCYIKETDVLRAPTNIRVFPSTRLACVCTASTVSSNISRWHLSTFSPFSIDLPFFVSRRLFNNDNI